MTSLRSTPDRRPSPSTRRRVATAASLALGLALALAGCKDDDTAPLTPAGAALEASAPAVAAAHVPPPPALQQAAAAAPAPAASGDYAGVHARLESTLSRNAVCTADTDCHAVAVGAKACGGPTGYRAYSSTSVATADVEALAQQERDLAAQAARASHEVSPCFMLADPGARCQQNKCVTGRPGSQP